LPVEPLLIVGPQGGKVVAKVGEQQGGDFLGPAVLRVPAEGLEELAHNVLGYALGVLMQFGLADKLAGEYTVDFVDFGHW